MQNEVTICYFEYKVSGKVGLDMFKSTKREKKLYATLFFFSFFITVTVFFIKEKHFLVIFLKQNFILNLNLNEKREGEFF